MKSEDIIKGLYQEKMETHLNVLTYIHTKYDNIHDRDELRRKTAAKSDYDVNSSIARVGQR